MLHQSKPNTKDAMKTSESNQQQDEPDNPQHWQQSGLRNTKAAATTRRRRKPSKRDILETACHQVESVLAQHHHFDVFDSKDEEEADDSLSSTRPNSTAQRIFDKPPLLHHYLDGTVRGIDRNLIPPSCLPFSVHCELSQDRAQHKWCQIEAMLRIIVPLMEEYGWSRIVEFGAGSGHLGLAIASLRPSSQVTLLERKEYACQQARNRMTEAGLKNVTVISQSLHEFCQRCPPFDLGVSLHSCGVLTDAAMGLCLFHGASFCLCPCCYGQASKHLPANYLPRCRALQSLRTFATTTTQTPPLEKGKNNPKKNGQKSRPAHLSIFYQIAKAADSTTAVESLLLLDDGGIKSRSDFQRVQRCMQIVDTDRLLWVQEEFPHYIPYMTQLPPSAQTPKNNVIIGIRSSSSSDQRGDIVDDKTSQLSVLWNASAEENVLAEEGERQKTGLQDFQTTSTTTKHNPQ